MKHFQTWHHTSAHIPLHINTSSLHWSIKPKYDYRGHIPPFFHSCGSQWFQGENTWPVLLSFSNATFVQAQSGTGIVLVLRMENGNVQALQLCPNCPLTNSFRVGWWSRPGRESAGVNLLLEIKSSCDRKENANNYQRKILSREEALVHNC